MNRKAVQRLWALAGLNVPKRKCFRRPVPGKHSHLVASRPQEIWCYDFVQDRTKEGRTMRILNVVDEFTRECLAIEVDRRFTAEDVIDVLEVLVWRHGAPKYLRSDNGPEFVARVVQTWLKEARIQTLYIAPGCPWENGYAESFNGKFKDEFLDGELFGSFEECRFLSGRYLREYNYERPHSALGYETPAFFAAQAIGRLPGSAGAPIAENRV